MTVRSIAGPSEGSAAGRRPTRADDRPDDRHRPRRQPPREPCLRRRGERRLARDRCRARRTTRSPGLAAFQIVPVAGPPIVGVVLVALVVAVAVNELWALELFHVAFGGLWTGVDLSSGSSSARSWAA